MIKALMGAVGETLTTRSPRFQLQQHSWRQRIMWMWTDFGTILKSRPIRAAHCLTSIQVSSSPLKSIVINGETSLSIYTVLEVYRVSDMELVSALPSAEDEVNVACFHPLAGGGLVYGTKHNGGHAPRPDHFFEARAVELQDEVILSNSKRLQIT
ncbi:unnamed protein product [Lactuca saligna]|uniref:Uncharacterized protein n=1 Tax=Lactuca saligna TaxID=75948 RepID=A0AA35YBY0_LACSI|nr:unnamed protein product [Lactuca saligna]